MVKEILLITGNKNKLLEFKQIMDDVGVEFLSMKLDLEEIQSMDLEEICKYKVKKAFEIIKKPVIVEDTGFFLDDLNGLPGPFIKFFEKKLGSKALVRLLGESKNRSGIARTCIVYYDGVDMIIAMGEVKGRIVETFIDEGEGFGFDFCFIPDGYDKTYAQLGTKIKNKISQRRLAIENFKKKLLV